MPSPSKEQQVMELVLQHSPYKSWRFAEIMHQAKVSRAAANKWIRQLVAKGLLNKIQQTGKHPTYCAGERNTAYITCKRVYALDRLYQSGLLTALAGLASAQLVILFGSMAKGDWYKDSDIDVFIYGDTGQFRKDRFEHQLKHPIELHIFRDAAEIHKVRSGLMENVMRGYVVKGDIALLIALLHGKATT